MKQYVVIKVSEWNGQFNMLVLGVADTPEAAEAFKANHEKTLSPGSPEQLDIFETDKIQ